MLVLEYMEGGDLLSCIQQDCYPVPAGQFTWYSKGGHIARDVAKGIIFLHKRKVIIHAVCVACFADCGLPQTISEAQNKV